MQKVYEPIDITDEMVTMISYSIPIDKENFIAINELDMERDFEDTLCGLLWEILGHDNADYSFGFIGHKIYIDVDLLNFDEKIRKVKETIDEYTREARIASEFFSDGEEVE